MAFKSSHKRIQTSMATERNASEASNKSDISASHNSIDEAIKPIFRRLSKYVKEASVALNTTEPEIIIISAKNDSYSASAFICEKEGKKMRGIEIGKNLILEFTPEELRAIISHEVSHLKHNDMERKEYLNFKLGKFDRSARYLGTTGIISADLFYLSSKVNATAIAINGYLETHFSSIAHYFTNDILKDILIVGAIGIGLKAIMALESGVSLIPEYLSNALNRRRELRADREAALVVGPRSMISALNKLGKLEEEQINELLSKEKKWIKLLVMGISKALEIIESAHPSFHKRTKRLERLARQIGDLS
jgi:Zn-dependent protease with chaperone function